MGNHQPTEPEAEYERRRKYAWSVVEETTSTIKDINERNAGVGRSSIKDLRSWQRSLMTLIFAVLAAMSPIFFATNKLPPHRLTFLLGIGFLFFDGVYLAENQLRTIETDLRESQISMSDVSKLLRTRLDIARGHISHQPTKTYSQSKKLDEMLSKRALPSFQMMRFKGDHRSPMILG